ncbi:MAG: hypothetical protein L6247_01410 [Desulfobacteraceae bacterium]|nr:hypothetical protein [Desulfobacteraceae bacterium]
MNFPSASFTANIADRKIKTGFVKHVGRCHYYTIHLCRLSKEIQYIKGDPCPPQNIEA